MGGVGRSREAEADDVGLAVSVVLPSGGCVGLTWTLRPWPESSGCWAASGTHHLAGGR
ncbi:DUF6228 family protein [Streptomyces sp. NPDC000878]